MVEPTARLSAAFDPQPFRALGHGVVEQLADYLTLAQGRNGPVLPVASPAAMLARWPAAFPEEPAPALPEALRELLSRVIAQSHHLHHPRYVGHQVSAPLPAAALFEMCGSLLNNGMAVYEMGPVATAMERSVLSWMVGLLSLPAGAGGVLTSGGSAGNLTALLAARQARAGFDLWGAGAHAGPPLALLCSTEVHYSIARSLQIMGWGQGGCVPVAVDERHRLRPEALPAAMAAAEAAGRRVIAVVASAGATATGAYDPLTDIADFCRDRGLWLHVDGAHGAAAALSPRHRHLLEGIERADSVVWDAHKLVLQPALVTAVLFADGRRSYEAFAQEASYLFSGERSTEDSFDTAQRTLECTKRMMSLQLYLALSLYGTRLLSDHVEHAFALARRLHELLAEAPDFAVPVEPQGNILCFRHLPAGMPPEAADAHQERVRERVVASGAFYLVKTRLRGAVHLRVALMNSLTGEGDLLALLAAVRAAAREG